MKHVYLAFAMSVLILVPHAIHAQLDLTAVGVAAIEDFSSFSASGFSPGSTTPGSLDSDRWITEGWSAGNTTLGGTFTSGDFARGTTTGGESSGGIYAYTGSATQPALVFQPTGSDWTPGTITLRAINNTGTTLIAFDLAYDVVEINNEGRSNSLNAAFAINSTGTLPGSYTAIAALDFATTEASTGAEIITARSTTVSGISVAPGDYIFIEWSSDDVSGSGSRDEFGLDNISITPLSSVSCSGPPSLAASALSVSNIEANSAEIGWTNGDGLARLVVLKAGSPISNAPVDNTSYTANSTFGNGSELSIGSGEFVVFNGGSGPVAVDGLSPGTSYHVAIFEYNCAPGSELYGSASTTSATTLPGNPENFDVVCIGETSIDLDWDAPLGIADGILIFARQGVTPTDPSGPASGYTGANSDFSLASSYGTGGNLVYAGSADAGGVQITGLTNGLDYTFKAFSYLGTGSTYSNGTQRARTIDQEEVDNPVTAPTTTQVELSWTNPDVLCFDEILVVANESTGIGFTPTGTYIGTANPVYAAADQVVFAAAGGNTVTISSLTDGTQYFFELFVRRGSVWSSGVEVSAIPNDLTVLERGDLVIVAVNTDLGGGTGNDEVCFFAFEDIKPGTSIDFTDNGWERSNPGEWGDTEGTVRMTWNGASDIAAGSVICIQGSGNSDGDFSAFICGADETSNWGFSSQNGATNFNLNSSDDIFILQNGIWTNPSGSQNATYSGNVLYGWTATGWGVGSGTALSNLYPGLECFNSDVTGLSNNDKAKYTGPSTAASRIEWIGRINDPTNWTGYADNSLYNAASPDYSGSATGCPFTINAATITAGTWTGNEDINWFNCNNWEDLRVPDANTDVEVASGAPNNPTIDATAAFSDNFGDTALCNNLQILGGTVSVENAADQIDVYGNLGISFGATLDMSDGGTAGGTMNLHGNWTNEPGTSAFDEARSTVRLVGTTDQVISVGTGNHEGFHSLEVDKAAGSLILGQDILVDEGELGSGILTLTNGLINATGNTLSVRNGSASAISYSGNGVFLYDGTLARRVDIIATYDFPVGSSSLQQLFTVTLDPTLVFTGPGADSLNVSFTNPSSGSISASANTEGAFEYNELLDAGYWTCTSSTAISSGTYDITASLDGSTNATGSEFVMMKRPNAAADWEIIGSLAGSPTISGALVTVQRIDFSSFSDFAIAKATATLPVAWMGLDATPIGQHVQLEWATASELQNAFFVVERSTDGNIYESIGQVEATGNSQSLSRYEFVDGDLAPNQYIYRIRQVDIDGQFSYSPEAWVEIKSLKSGLTVNAFPNPVLQEWNVQLAGPQASSFQLSISDVQGRVVMSDDGVLSGGISRQVYDLSTLPSGVYLYRIRANGVFYSGKMFKQ